MMHEILKRDWEEEQMPEEWKKSEFVPIYKQKGDPLECGNFRGIKLLEHGMKMFEKVLERRLRKLITVNNMQFGFSSGKGTTDAVFIIK
jgi:tryptophan 2,3-dioxygenase